MRVVLNLEQLCSPVPGGIARVAAELARLLPERFPEDEYIGVVARHSAAEVSAMRERFGLTDLPIDVLAFPRPVLFEGWHWLGRPGWDRLIARRGRVDVVHSPHAAVPPRAKGAALVVTIHDAATEVFPDAYPLHGRLFHRRGFVMAARRADRVITVSQAAKAEILAHTPIGSDLIEVVRSGVAELRSSAVETSAARARLGLGENPLITWVGTMEPRKNLVTLLDAFAGLVREITNARLVLIGPDGWKGVGEQIRARSAVLGDRVVFAGRCSDAERNALIATSDVFAFPSVHEGFGLPVLEAMQLGTAVLASDIPAIAEVSSGAAQLVSSRDAGAWTTALVTLLRNPDARAALAVRGSQVAAARRWAEVADDTHAVYERAIERARSRA
ncbi:MAG: glycosyltransferase family 1 protein [Acidimicrobiia bacterium]